jgi:hypothetical protein
MNINSYCDLHITLLGNDQKLKQTNDYVNKGHCWVVTATTEQLLGAVFSVGYVHPCVEVG